VVKTKAESIKSFIFRRCMSLCYQDMPKSKLRLQIKMIIR